MDNFEKLESSLNLLDKICVTDIHEDCCPDETVMAITLQTPNGDYIELYDDGHWEYFEREDEL